MSQEQDFATDGAPNGVARLLADFVRSLVIEKWREVDPTPPPGVGWGPEHVSVSVSDRRP